MPSTGTLIVNAYTSRARIPLEDVAVTAVDDNGKLLGLQLTNSSGSTEPLKLTVPDKAASQAPGGVKPYASVNIYARAQGYEQILVRGIQVFPGTTTMQDLAMVPLSELPGSWHQAEVFDTPPQNL